MKNKFEIPELEIVWLEDDMYANGTVSGGDGIGDGDHEYDD